MKPTTFVIAAALVAAVVLKTSAPVASTLLSLDLDTLTQEADHIVVGRVLDAVAFQRESRIYTLHRVEISKVVNGNNTEGEIIEVITPGGTVGHIRQAVSGAAELEVGAQYLLFLEDRGDPSFSYVMGMSQGAYALLKTLDGADLEVAPSTHLPRLVTRDKATGRLIESSPWLNQKRPLKEVLQDISAILGSTK